MWLFVLYMLHVHVECASQTPLNIETHFKDKNIAMKYEHFVSHTFKALKYDRLRRKNGGNIVSFMFWKYTTIEHMVFASNIKRNVS